MLKSKIGLDSILSVIYSYAAHPAKKTFSASWYGLRAIFAFVGLGDFQMRPKSPAHYAAKSVKDIASGIAGPPESSLTRRSVGIGAGVIAADYLTGHTVSKNLWDQSRVLTGNATPYLPDFLNDWAYYDNDYFSDTRPLDLRRIDRQDFRYRPDLVRAYEGSEAAKQYVALINQFAEENGIHAVLHANQIFQESRFNVSAVSNSQPPAYGIAQFKIATAQRTYRQGFRQARGLPPLTNAEMREKLMSDPEFSLELSSFHMKQLYDEFNNDPVLALAAYSGGSGAVTNFGNISSGKEWLIELAQRRIRHNRPGYHDYGPDGNGQASKYRNETFIYIAKTTGAGWSGELYGSSPRTLDTQIASVDLSRRAFLRLIPS
jgi:hypothetical protein